MKKITSKEIRYTDDSMETRRIFNDIRKLQPLSLEDETKFARRARELHDEKSRMELVRHNTLFVVSVAKNYLRAPFTLSELWSAGNMGLCNASMRFDERKGHRFITYAASWVQKEIIEYIDESTHPIHLPDSHQKKMSKMRKAVSKLEQDNLRRPYEEEIANMLGVEVEAVKELCLLNASVSSCDEHLVADDKESITFVETMASDSPATDTIAQQHFDYQVLVHEIARTLKNPDDLEIFLAFAEGSKHKIEALAQKRKTTPSQFEKVYNAVRSLLSHNPVLREYYYA